MVTDWLASPYYGRQHMGTKGDNMKRDAWIFAGLVTVTVAGVVWLLVSKTIEIEVTREVKLDDVEGRIASAYIRARRPSRVEVAAS